MFEFRILGTRGTTTVCSSEYLKYGGSTTCFSVRTEKGLIIIDAGTGISRIAADLKVSPSSLPMTMLFTHFHLDHIAGLPSFDPLYDKKSTISIMADPRRNDNWRESLTTLMGKPYWPIGLGEADAALAMKNIPVDDEKMELYGINVQWCSVPHPQKCLAYRFECSTKNIVVATDSEFDIGNISDKFLHFCTNADCLIYDAQYTPEEYAKHIGWGHSSWKTATHIAKTAKVKRLVLTHHAPDRKDSAIDAIVEQARKEFSNTDAAIENMLL